MSDEQSNDPNPTIFRNTSRPAPAINHVTTPSLAAIRQPSPTNIPTNPIERVNLSSATGSDGVHTAGLPRALPHPQQAVFLAPPPPPPPPPSGVFVPPSFAFHHEAFTSHELLPNRHPSVEALANEHEKLRDFGDQVVGLRFRLAAKRKQLRVLRFQTGVKDGLVFNLLRQYSQANNIALPKNIEDALDDASGLRDALGPLEAEYDNAEVDYNALEWSYTDKETRFVEGLVDSGFVASGGSEQRRLSTPHDDAFLTRLTTGHLDVLNHTNSEDLVQSEDPCGQLIESLGLERELFEEEKSELRQAKSLDEIHSTASYSTGQKRRDLAEDEFRSHLYDKMRRVNAWLLQIIEASPLQKAQLRAELGFDEEIDDVTWRRLAKEALVQNRRTAVRPTTDIAGQCQQVNENVTASSIHVQQARASTVRDESMEFTTPEQHEPRVFEQNRIQGTIRTESHPNSGGNGGPVGSRTTSSTINNGRDSCSSQMNSRHTSDSDDLITGSDATSHRSCSCEQCAYSLASTVESPALGPELRHDTASAPTTPTPRNQDERNLDTPRQPLDLGKSSHEECDLDESPSSTIRDKIPPRLSKEQYLDRFVLPSSDLTSEPPKTLDGQSTAPSPPTRQCPMIQSESATFSPSSSVSLDTPSNDQPVSTSNPFSSGCLVM